MLDYFMAIWNILGYRVIRGAGSPFWQIVSREIGQPWKAGRGPAGSF
jgi:hypothetical protein